MMDGNNMGFNNQQKRYLKTRQRGAVLAIVLMFLLLLTIIGISALNTTTLEERMAGNLKDRQLAFQSAETAIITAETWLSSLQGNQAPQFPNNANGLYQMPTNGIPLWQSVDWSGANLVTHPNIPGAVGSAPALTKVNTQPKYVIEDLGKYQEDDSSKRTDATSTFISYFRITARGTGGTDASVVIVESIYGRPFE